MSITTIDARSPLRYSDNAASAMEQTSLIPQEEWWNRALCAETDPEAFFPEKGESSKTAKQVCDAGCPIKDLCLEWALAHHERFGVWGGKSERERRELIAERERHEADQRPAA